MPGVVTRGVQPGHAALDIACIPGTPVRAAHSGQGRVERSYTHGITFVLEGDNSLETSYSHLQSASPAGSYKRGDLIGHCGNTGIWSSGPHLHFESSQPHLLGSMERETGEAITAGTASANGGTPQPLPIGGSADALRRLP